MSDLDNINDVPRRNLPAIGLRAVTGVILAAVILAVLLFTPLWAATLVVALLAGVAFYEHARMTPTLGWSETVVGVIFCVLLMPLTYWGGLQAAIAGMVLALLITGFICMAAGPPAIAIEKTALIAFGYIYIAAPLACLVGLLQLPNGIRWAVFLLVIVALTDIGGYFVGSLTGRHKLVPRISPNKTWEGLFGGLIIAGAGGVLLFNFWPPMEIAEVWQMVIFSLVVSLSSVAGDTFESALKRIRGVKDSGKILPGHGGMLDRIDSYLIALPTILLLVYVWPQIGW